MNQTFKIVLIVFLSTVAQNLYSQQTFSPVTSQVGISVLSGNMGQDCAWADIDNDGDLDLALSYSYPAIFEIYRNDDGTYSNITSSSGLSTIAASSIFWAEITGDKYTDMLTASNAYKNNGDGTFASLGQVANHTSSLTDFDQDGNIDILDIAPPAIKFGNGDGTFGNTYNLPASSIISSVCLDFNNDGFVDILLGASDQGTTKLLINNGDGSFDDVTTGSGISFSHDVYGVSAGDINNDGLLDIYAALHKGQLSSAGNKLLKNNGDGSFSDITTSSGAVGQPSTRTASFADYNNDGWLDILVDDHYKGNFLYRNNGDETFSEVADELNIRDVHPTAGIGGDYFGTSWGDYNNDGAIDFFGSGHWSLQKLYENQQCPNNFLVLTLVGTETNKDAIGVMVKAVAGELEITQTVIAGDGGNNFSSLPLEFGLGQNSIIDYIEIHWINSPMQTITSIAANSFLTVVEGDPVDVVEVVDNDFNCYPNPFDEKLSITLNHPAKSNFCIKLSDINGKIITQFPVSDFGARKGNIMINLEKYNLSPGMYLLKAENGSTIKIVKK